MTQSVDPDFAARVAEYQQKSKKGIAFQAVGTVGGKKVRPPRASWRARPLRMLFRYLMMGLIFKVVLFHIVQEVGYTSNDLSAQQSHILVQKVMELILYPDPISVQVRPLLNIGQLFFATELRKVL